MQRIGMGFLAGGLILIFLTGCWDRRELNELGIVSGIGIDKVGKQYQVSVQVVIPEQVSTKSSKADAPVTMYKAVAPTLFEAFRKLTETSPRKIYVAHIRVLILSESVAQEGIAKILDLLVRNPESRIDYFVMVAKGTLAENVLKILTPLENIPADAMFHSLYTTSKEWSPITGVTVDTLMDQLMTRGMNPVLPGISIIEDDHSADITEDMQKIDPPFRLRYSGLAAFKKDKLIGWLSSNESKGYNYIRNNVKSTVNNLKCPDDRLLSLEIIRSQTEVKSHLEHGEPIIEVQIKMEANIGEVECSIDLTDPQTIEMLQIKQEENLEKVMEHSVEVMQQKYKVDIFGFGQSIYNSYPKLWKKYEENWDDKGFTDLKVVYKTKVHIRNTGMTSDSIESRMKENK